eukprot:scaffold87579_cov14-Prasinocladus_malaysianus.AAC.1
MTTGTTHLIFSLLAPGRLCMKGPSLLQASRPGFLQCAGQVSVVGLQPRPLAPHGVPIAPIHRP